MDIANFNYLLFSYRVAILLTFLFFKAGYVQFDSEISSEEHSNKEEEFVKYYYEKIERISPIQNEAKEEAAAKYFNRTLLIKKYCQKNLKSDHLLAHSNTKFFIEKNSCLWFVNNFNFIYCQMNKVSSTTWISHILKLYGIDMKQYQSNLVHMGEKIENTRRNLRKQIFRLVHESIEQASEQMLTFLFVREPFGKIASAYYNKMFDLRTNKGYFRMLGEKIVHKYRSSDSNLTATHVTPTEFVQYLVDSWKSNQVFQLDNHFRPMWTLCPVCAIDFDIVGHLETFDEDTNFILKTLNLTSLLQENLHENPRYQLGNDQDPLEMFYKDVPKELIQELYEFCRKDYELFGYPPPFKYINTVNKDNYWYICLFSVPC